MAALKDFIEFSEDLGTRYTGLNAVQAKVKYRLMVLKGEIPYDTASLDSYLYSHNNHMSFLNDLRCLLGDITADIRVTRDGRVLVAGIAVQLPDRGDDSGEWRQTVGPTMTDIGHIGRI